MDSRIVTEDDHDADSNIQNERSDETLSGSYSLNSYAEIIHKETKKSRRNCRKHLCVSLVATFFCVGIGTAFGMYFGFQSTAKVDRHVDQVYRGRIKMERLDPFSSELMNNKSPQFAETAKKYEMKLDLVLKNSSVKDIFLYSEVLAFDKCDDDQLLVTFNVYLITRKSFAEVKELEKLLRDSLSGGDAAAVMRFDPASVEIKLRSSDSSDVEDLQISPKADDNFERRDDQANALTVPPKTNKTELKTLEPSRSRNMTSTRLGLFNDIPKTRQPALETCTPITLDFCKNLDYNSTSAPNLLHSHQGNSSDYLLNSARALVDSECSPYIQDVLCRLLQPPCRNRTTETSSFIPLQPCRNVCLAALASCKTRLGLLSHNPVSQESRNPFSAIHILLQCEKFPLDDGLGKCDSEPAVNRNQEMKCVANMISKGQKNRICDGLMDCNDFSDEMACDYCPLGYVHCGVGAACINSEKRCDGKLDCPNGSDERGCLTVAASKEAANFVHQYFDEGFVFVTEGNKTGKICVDSLVAPNIPVSRRNNLLEKFGDAACKTMSYRAMNRIEIRTDNEDAYEYAYLIESNRLRPAFQKNACSHRQVLYLSCTNLECGIRPVHMHPDRPARNAVNLPASHGDWPWFAALFRDGIHVCDATLVSNQWLLTSASCFEGKQRALWTARFAAVRLSADAPWEQELVLVGMIRSPAPRSSMVLVKLETAVIYSDFVRPSCIARLRQFGLSPSSRCVTLAWTKDEENLYEMTSGDFVSERCNGTGRICTRPPSTNLPCKVEEFPGSPLLCQETEGSSWSIAGVANSKYSCDMSVSQTIHSYEATYQNYDWIKQAVNVK